MFFLRLNHVQLAHSMFVQLHNLKSVWLLDLGILQIAYGNSARQAMKRITESS
jgi:hypothetical protein